MASVQKRPDGRWRARYRDDAGREHAKHFSRRAEAERWLSSVQSDLLRGTYVDPAAGRMTFAAFANTWLEAQPHRPGTRRLYERTLRLHVFPRLGDRPLSSIRRSDVQALVTASAAHLAPKTVENHFRLIKAIFNAAVEDQLLALSPCRKIARQPVADTKVVPLTMDEIHALVLATPPQYKALVLLAVGTGLRQGEALGLREQDVDFLRREVHVRHQLVSVPGVAAYLGPTKTPSSMRVVPAPAFVLEALADHISRCPAGPFGVLFTNTKGDTVNRTSLHRSFVAAVRAAGLEGDVGFHRLRHTYASLLIDGGESVTVVADRLGHKNAIETLRTYSHLWPSSDDRTRRVLENAFTIADSSRTDADQQASDLRFSAG